MGVVRRQDFCLLQEFRTGGVFPRFWTGLLPVPSPRSVDGARCAASVAHHHSEGSDFPSAAQHCRPVATARGKRGSPHLGVPAVPASWTGMILAMIFVVPVFAVIATVFIPFGQLVGW